MYLKNTRMEAAEIMNKILFLLGEEFYSCLACAYTAEFLLVEPNNDYELKTIFISEIKTINSPDLFTECDLIAAIGSEEQFQKEQELNNFRNKLLILDLLEDEEYGDEKDITNENGQEKNDNETFVNDFNFILPRKDYDQKLDPIIKTIIDIINTLDDGNDYLNFQWELSWLIDPSFMAAGYKEDEFEDEDDYDDDLEDNCDLEYDPYSDEYVYIDTEDDSENTDIMVFQLEERYIQGFEVLERFHTSEEKTEFHKNFIMEILDQTRDPKIDKLISEYDRVNLETLKLIGYISPVIPHRFEIGYVYCNHPHFFDDDILDASVRQGYKSMAIEYKDKNGQYKTIYRTKSGEKEFFEGRIKYNIYKIIKN